MQEVQNQHLSLIVRYIGLAIAKTATDHYGIVVGYMQMHVHAVGESLRSGGAMLTAEIYTQVDGVERGTAFLDIEGKSKQIQ